MANYRKIIPFIKAWEDGLSSDRNDLAAAVPSPIKDPKTGHYYHTNKGITYQTWKAYMGSNAAQRFVNMSNEDWERIWKNGYWDAVDGDQLKSQAIADAIANWYWGSGTYAVTNAVEALNSLKKGKPLPYTSAMNAQLLAALNKVNESDFLEAYRKEQAAFYKAIVNRNPSQAVFLKGWMNRMNNLYDRYLPKVSKKRAAGRIAIPLVILLVAGVVLSSNK